jgi:acyl-CoA dehydrogenase
MTQHAVNLQTTLDFSDDSGHVMLRDTVASFFDRHLPESRIRACDQSHTIPVEILNEVARIGWFGLSISESYGGAGADVTYGAVLIEEVSRRFPSLGVILVVSMMAARALREHGTETQKAELLPRMAEGSYMFAFGITEPDGGTDALRGKSRARRTDAGWSVTGSKLYTSFGTQADAILMLARTAEAPTDKPARGLSLILVPTDQSAVDRRPMQLMGMRAACTSETYMDAAAAPADALLGEEGRGFYHLISTLDEERILAAASYVGIVQGVLDVALPYARERMAFGRPIGAFQAVQHPLADVATELEAARLMTMKAAWMLSQGLECSTQAVMAKVFGAEASQHATDRGMRVLAGFGMVVESPMERLLRDARLGLFSPISNEMGRNFIGERLGLPRSY